MKICPNCQQTYSDDSLNFCLNDGTVLSQVQPQNRMPETVLMNPPGITNSPNQYAAQPNPAINKNSNSPINSRPAKKNKTFIWVLVTLGLVALLCGGSFLGLLGLSQLQENNSNNQNSKLSTNTATGNRINNNSTQTNSDDHIAYQTVDLSGWVRENSDSGLTEYADNELTIASKKKGYYYVLVAPQDYKTDDAATRVTVRNKDQMSSGLGYGLIFHSNPSPLIQDYAFLIDTVKKRFRIVYHAPQKETAAVDWTNSRAIKGDSDPNILEVKDTKNGMDFYINGQKVTSLQNSKGYQDGVAGIYSGDAAKISFSNLEIDK